MGMWPALTPSLNIARELESTEAACSTTTAPPTGPLPQPAEPLRIRWCPRKPFRPSRFCAYLEASLATGQLTNGGPLQRVLAERVQSWTGATHAVVLTANGTAALHALVSAHALMRKRRLRWATQAYTFPVSMQGPLADSVVLDLDAKHWGPCLAGLDSVKSDIDGVIVTNVFGYLADVGVYEAWCRANGKLLVFDNAATPLGRVAGRCIHDYGDGAIISLHETKPIGRGEGGAAFAPPTLHPYLQQAINFGFDVPAGLHVGSRLASNYRMSDIAAAAVLDHLDTVASARWDERVGALAQHAHACLRRHGLSPLLPTRQPCLPACLIARLPAHACAHAVEQGMQGSGVEAKRYYRPLADKSAAPRAWHVFDTSICLPLHVDLTRADVERMCCEVSALANTSNVSRM